MHLVEALDRRPPELGLGVEDRAPLLAAPGGEDLVQERDQGGGVDRAVLHGREARVLGPLRVSHGPGERRPVTVALQADDPEPAAVLVAIVVDRRVGHGLPVGHGEGHAEAERDRQVEGDACTGPRVGARSRRAGRGRCAHGRRGRPRSRRPPRGPCCGPPCRRAGRAGAGPAWSACARSPSAPRSWRCRRRPCPGPARCARSR